MSIASGSSRWLAPFSSVVLAILVIGFPGSALADRAASLPAIAPASGAEKVTIILGLPDPMCGMLSAAQWKRVLTVKHHRSDGFSPRSNQVTRSGLCMIQVAATEVKDPKAFAGVLAARGHLVFYGMGDLPQLTEGSPFTHPTAIRCDASRPPTPCVVIDGSDLDLAAVGVSYDQFGQPQVNFGTKKTGARRLATYTSTHIRNHMAIVLDATVVTDPTIQGALPGSGVINNLGSVDVARRIAAELGSGELPATFKILSIRQ